MVSRIRVATRNSLLQTIAIMLLTVGADNIQQGNYVVGGALATVGFVLLIVANYISVG